MGQEGGFMSLWSDLAWGAALPFIECGITLQEVGGMREMRQVTESE